MDVIRKIGTALRGGTWELLEDVVDANGIRILSQEIHDAESAVHQAKQNLCKVTAERLSLQRESGRLQHVIAAHEKQALVYMIANNEAAARDLAQQIADNENLLQDLISKQEHLEQHESELKSLLHRAIRQIEQYRRELRMVQATRSAQTAVEKISSSDNLLPGKLRDMQYTLTRIREQQQDSVDKLHAEKLVLREFPGKNQSHGKESNAEAVDSVLDRLRLQAESS